GSTARTLAERALQASCAGFSSSLKRCGGAPPAACGGTAARLDRGFEFGQYPRALSPSCRSRLARPFARHPKMKLATLVAVGALALGTIAPAGAKTFRYAFQGDLNALDPYTLNETFTSGALGNVMEGLTKRDKDLKIIPGLAERWEIVDPLRWRFHLRK